MQIEEKSQTGAHRQKAEAEERTETPLVDVTSPGRAAEDREVAVVARERVVGATTEVEVKVVLVGAAEVVVGAAEVVVTG